MTAYKRKSFIHSDIEFVIEVEPLDHAYVLTTYFANGNRATKDLFSITYEESDRYKLRNGIPGIDRAIEMVMESIERGYYFGGAMYDQDNP
ncbi:hypothetical protein L3C95_33185 [Chitinophaga filiformis]|uniref:hypothetical protein n=1 Tax=Chitinophaga filiformis TaxID=104663 RepID=UPI001F460B64|nr:hypothetical protein [Chitinophaga filiformis]MCF6407789.1 hypothetical protein [Chitinophaga filiformis]